MMDFESLPNEILLSCFEYLNGKDIFHGFDGLNCRFNILIQNVPLYLNFEHIRKSIFDQFCTRILLNPVMKSAIYSLRLSDAMDTCNQIQAFLHFFHLNEFPNLRLLTLIDIERNISLEDILLSLSNLREFYFITKYSHRHQLLASVPSTLRVLSMPESFLDFIPIDKILSVTHLILSGSVYPIQLYQIFKCLPMLEYLKVENLCFSSNLDLSLVSSKAVHLTQFIAGIRLIQFDSLEFLFKQMQNFKNLNLFSPYSKEICDAYRWERIISSSLSNLNIFQFHFHIDRCDYRGVIVLYKDLILNQFQQFQTDFWHKEHQWHTAYELTQKFATIFTIPYSSKNYTLTLDTNTNCKMMINKSKLLSNVTQLTYFPRTEILHHYFSNVKSLIFNPERLGYNNIELNYQYIQVLKLNVNLSNVKYLEFPWNYTMKSSLLLEILKETPNVSSITVPKSSLVPLFSNYEAREYLNRMIKKLVVNGTDSLFTSYELEHFCNIFSNLEHLECVITSLNELFYILCQLSKLSSIQVSSIVEGDIDNIDLFEEKIGPKLKQNFMFHLHYRNIHYDTTRLYIWIGENIIT
ncbi:unnamed protein product [Rotaria sp. Silwood1]|nr:unnamed protein product [Rotaria sp. Silwood1]